MSKNELSSTGRLSSAAQLFLSTQRAAPSERSEANLLKLRAATQAYIAPAVERVLRSADVTTENVIVNNVPCLEVKPSVITKPWKILYGFGGGFIQGSAFEDLTIAAPLSSIYNLIDEGDEEGSKVRRKNLSKDENQQKIYKRNVELNRGA